MNVLDQDRVSFHYEHRPLDEELGFGEGAPRRVVKILYRVSLVFVSVRTFLSVRQSILFNFSNPTLVLNLRKNRWFIVILETGHWVQKLRVKGVYVFP